MCDIDIKFMVNFFTCFNWSTQSIMLHANPSKFVWSHCFFYTHIRCCKYHAFYQRMVIIFAINSGWCNPWSHYSPHEINNHCDKKFKYRKTTNIRLTLVSNIIVDHSDVVGASPVGAVPTTSSFSTWHLASRVSAKTVAGQYDKLSSVGIRCVLY